jgi:aminopeptidase
MLTEKQMNRYADILLWGLQTSRRGRIKKGETVLLRYDAAAIRLAEILYEKLLDMSLNPIQRVGATPNMEVSFYKRGNTKQLVFQPPGEELLYQQLNGSIYLHAPQSLTHLSEVDPNKIAKATLARKYIRDLLDERESAGKFSWTLCMYPTEELAKHANLTLKEYCSQVGKACFLNRVDPVLKWQEIYNAALSVKKWLNKMKVAYYHIESKHIDLKITPGEKRRWVGISGHNIPSFELFISPDWRGTHGIYFANQPSYRSGNYVTDVRLEFKQGSAAKINAGTGESFVRKQLKMDKGACRIGEFSLTDKRFSKISKFMANTLYDENYGGKFGNCHLAVGSSYADTYAGSPKELTQNLKESLGFNDSALHWDLVNTEKKRVIAHLTNGRRITVYENGKFTY